MDFDVSTIEGYEEMSAEDKLAAVLKAYEEFQPPKPDYTGYVKKDQYDKLASDYAKTKKQLNADKTAEQQAQEEKDEELANLREKVSAMEKERTVANHRAAYLAMGYADDLATATAEALADGDTETVFANQRKFQEAHDKAYKAELLKDVPPMPNGKPNGDVMTLEKFRKLSSMERMKFAQEHPDEYKELYK